jgi:hypothetical protein
MNWHARKHWEQLVHKTQVKICCFSPHLFVCKLEMYSINTGVLLLTFHSNNLPLKQYVLFTTSVHNTCPHRIHFLCTLCANSCMHFLLSTIPKLHFSYPGCHLWLYPELFVQKSNYLSQASDKHHMIHYSCNHNNQDYILLKKTITKITFYE